MHAVFTNFLAFYHWSLPKTRRKKQLRHQIIPTQLYIALLYWMYYQNLNIICEFYHKAVNGSMVNFLAPSIAMQSSQSSRLLPLRQFADEGFGHLPPGAGDISPPVVILASQEHAVLVVGADVGLIL